LCGICSAPAVFDGPWRGATRNWWVRVVSRAARMKLRRETVPRAACSGAGMSLLLLYAGARLVGKSGQTLRGLRTVSACAFDHDSQGEKSLTEDGRGTQHHLIENCQFYPIEHCQFYSTKCSQSLDDSLPMHTPKRRATLAYHAAAALLSFSPILPVFCCSCNI